jgi:putative thioredoxin
VRAFIDALIPSPSELEQARARELRQAGDAKGAAEALRKALAFDPGNDPARLDLAEVMLDQKQVQEAQSLVDAVRPNIDWDDRTNTLRSAIAFARAAESGQGEGELKARINANRQDHDARLALAGLHAGAKRYAEALEQLLEIVRRDKDWKDGEARKQILAIFNLLADQPDVVSRYRRALASALY